MLAAADVADGRSQALASAGPTGATMTAALFALRRMHGVRRPALAVQLAVPGAAVRRRSSRRRREHRGSRRRPRPVRLPRRRLQPGGARGRAAAGGAAVGRRGGEEGLERRRRRARGACGADAIDFRGNVEGRDLLGDAADVIVTDGFTGNVVLKTLEGTARRWPVPSATPLARTRWRCSGASCCVRRSADCGARWIRTRPAERFCSACEASRWSAMAARARMGSPTRSGWPRAPSTSMRWPNRRAAGAIRRDTGGDA